MDAGQPGPANTAESLGWQLRGALPPLRLHSVSVYDINADILWLSEGALGPDEHGFVMEAIHVLSEDGTQAHWECNLEDGRGAFFLAVRAPQGELVGLVMILADAKSLAGGAANRIFIAPVRAVLQRMAILLRPPQAPAPAAASAAPAPVAPAVVAPAPPVAPPAAAPANRNAAPPTAGPATRAAAASEGGPVARSPRGPAAAPAARPAAPVAAPVVLPPASPVPPVASIPVVPAAASQGAENRNFVPDSRDLLDFVPVVRAEASLARDPDATGTSETLAPDVVDEILSFELVDEPPVAPPAPAPASNAEPRRKPKQTRGAELPVPPQRVPELKPQKAPRPFSAPAQAAPPPAPRLDLQTIPELHATEDAQPERYSDGDDALADLTDEAPHLATVTAKRADKPAHVRPPVVEAAPPDASQILPAPTLIPVPEWPKVEPIPELRAATLAEPASTGLHKLRAQPAARRSEAELIHDDMPVEAVPKRDTLPGEFVLYVREVTRLREGGRTRRYEVTLRSAADPSIEMPPDALSEAAAATESLYPDVLIAAELVSWLAQNPQAAHGNGDPVSFIIDVTAAALQDPEFPQLIAGQLGHADIATESIGFRISESTCVQHKPQVARFITACEKLGCFIVLDDFTLHAGSVDFLRSKALRLVMVDPKLTTAAMKDKVAQALVVAVCQAGKVLGIHCAVKGVDTQTRNRWFGAFGFDFAQGPLFPGAQPLETLAARKS